jgi:phage antirepressor YoqD-like protein
VAQAYIKNNLIPTSPGGKLTPNGAAFDNRDEFTIKTDFNITSSDRLAITLVKTTTRRTILLLSAPGS